MPKQEIKLSFQEQEAIKQARWIRANCETCPICGALTCGGQTAHLAWHQAVTDYATQLRTDATVAISQLRDDATAAITAANTRTDQVRTDATAAITSANNKITALTARVAALEAKVP